MKLDTGGTEFIDLKKDGDSPPPHARAHNAALHGRSAVIRSPLRPVRVSGMHTQNPKTGYDDMTSLYYLHEPGVSENLEARYIEVRGGGGGVQVVCAWWSCGGVGGWKTYCSPFAWPCYVAPPLIPFVTAHDSLPPVRRTRATSTPGSARS